jgi:hypothetical protein
MPTKLSRVPAKLTIDYGLCARAERYATGEHVHKLANLLTPYLVIPKLDEACPESFRTAEQNLRAFVTQITLTPERRLETLLMETAPIPVVAERPRIAT